MNLHLWSNSTPYLVHFNWSINVLGEETWIQEIEFFIFRFKPGTWQLSENLICPSHILHTIHCQILLHLLLNTSHMQHPLSTGRFFAWFRPSAFLVPVSPSLLPGCSPSCYCTDARVMVLDHKAIPISSPYHHHSSLLKSSPNLSRIIPTL